MKHGRVLTPVLTPTCAYEEPRWQQVVKIILLHIVLLLGRPSECMEDCLGRYQAVEDTYELKEKQKIRKMYTIITIYQANSKRRYLDHIRENDTKYNHHHALIRA